MFFYGCGVHLNLSGAHIELQVDISRGGGQGSSNPTIFRAGFYPFVRFSEDGDHVYVTVDGARTKLAIKHFFLVSESSQSDPDADDALRGGA